MKAVVLNRITRAEEIELTEVETPKVKSGWVLIRVRAFGMNHSEQILRLEEFVEEYIQKPVIPGIECVGEIVDASDSNFKIGQKVIAMMGGMGRSFDGSYAEFALLPIHHVFTVESNLDWAHLAAIPETYFTAWGSLFECLQLKSSDSILIRGATCALGFVAIQIAKSLGCRVLATTHRTKKLPLLEEADEKILDEGKLEGKIHVDKILDLIGARDLRDTMRLLNPGGICCSTGILGGVETLNNFDPITFIPNGTYLTGFYSNYPTQKIVDEIFQFIRDKNLTPPIGKIFDFENIREACIAQDNHSITGKIVVKI